MESANKEIGLWFGNENAPDDENPLYGTAKVVIALRELRDRHIDLPGGMLERALTWLAAKQDETSAGNRSARRIARAIIAQAPLRARAGRGRTR